jgi:hypothetical protein
MSGSKGASGYGTIMGKKKEVKTSLIANPSSNLVKKS